MGKALRRHHKERMKTKARRIYPGQSEAHYLADHIKACSCYGCGNRRKYDGPKIKEMTLKTEKEMDETLSL